MKVIALSVLLLTIVSCDMMPDIPTFLADVWEGTCNTCTTYADCDGYYMPNATIAIWECTAESGITVNGTDVNICILNQCDDDGDCNSGEHCEIIPCCDGEDEFYDNSTGIFSTICLADDICVDDNSLFAPTSNETCYWDADGYVWSSEEESVICNAQCPVSSGDCDMTPSTTDVDCIEDESCCDELTSKECFELLTTSWLYYTIGALLLICICCCGCGCLCWKKHKKGQESYDGMDEQTNHYNVYI